MKTQHLAFAVLIFISVQTKAQWLSDVRLTNEWHTSSVSPNNSWCVAAKGNFVHVVWIEDRDVVKQIYYRRSDDAGSNWGAEVRLPDSLSNAYNPSVTVSGQSVHVVWVDERDGNQEIYYKHSDDDGITWSADVRLTNDSGSSIFPSLSATGQFVHLAWEDDRDGNFEIYYKQSADGGLTWGPDTRLTNNTGYSSPPSIAASDSMVHVTWCDNRIGGMEIYYKHSTDYGSTWSADTRLTYDPDYSGDACIAESGSTVGVVWSDQRDGFLVNEIYFKLSIDGGLNWKPDYRLTYAGMFASFPSIAISGLMIHVIWSDERDGNFEIYYKHSTDGGSSWEPDERLTTDNAQSELASVAVSGPVVHTVWSDNRDSNYEIYYKNNPTGNPVNVFSPEANHSINIFPVPASDHFVIEVNQELWKEKPEIKILNVMAEIIYSEKLQAESQVINCKNFPPGIYFVKVESAKDCYTKRIVVQ